MSAAIRIPNIPPQREVVDLEGLLSTDQLIARFQRVPIHVPALPSLSLLQGSCCLSIA